MPTTDAEGRFELQLIDGEPIDILIQKDQRASVRLQGVSVPAEQTLELEIPSKPRAVAQWSETPPQITLTGVSSGETVSGTLTLDITIVSEEEAYVAYVYFGGEQRYPYLGYAYQQGNIQVPIDTTQYQDGTSYIKILAYDYNNNAVLYFVPVTVQNEENPAVSVPALTNLDLQSYSFGQNLGFYSKQREELFSKHHLKGDPYIIKIKGGRELDLRTAPAGANLFNRLYWGMVSGVEGYNVYRSFDGINYQKIGSVLNVYNPKLDDFSAQLAVNKKTYYKVAPYIDGVEGEGIVREVTPLPSFNVYLQSPANYGTNTSLTPTFVWENQSSAAMTAEVQYYSEITLFDATDRQVWYDGIDNTTELTYPGVLAPGSVYSWDIIVSYAYVIYQDDEYGISYALSAAGESTSDLGGTGSINGEFIFTTTTDTP